MKKYTALFLMLTLMLAGCTGCEKSEKAPAPKTEEKKEDVEETETYTFVDVLGESYVAELREDVPACTYD